jgi:hypothetical protein
MSNSTDQNGPGLPVVLSLKDVAELVVRQRELHEGLYNLVFQFQIAVGAVGPSPELIVPGAIFGVSGVGLEKVEKAGPHTIDAAVVNPVSSLASRKQKPKAAPKKSSKSKLA